MEAAAGIAAAAGVYLDAAKSYAFALSAALLIAYPFVVLAWSSFEGELAGGRGFGGVSISPAVRGKSAAPAPDGGARRSAKTRRSAPQTPLRARVHGLEIKGDLGGRSSGGASLLAFLLLALAAFAVLHLGTAALGFAVARLGGGGGAACEAARAVAAEQAPPAAATPAQSASVARAASAAAATAAAAVTRGPPVWLAAAVAAAGLGGLRALCLATARAEEHGRRQRKKAAKHMLRAGSGLLRRCSSSKQVICVDAVGLDAASASVHYALPPDAPESMWHHIELHARDWLDEHERGVFHYVNEIPHGAVQKFELQTKLPFNVIREDAKGSRRLTSFGQPVPFNYGCFPQTFRDPEEMDEVHGAPGDDDPLDVLDLCPEAVGVGEVVRCRPLGAVCLIDEGRADWKILAVNLASKSPLAAAGSIAEVEAIMPGRVEQILRWMDEFKQHSSRGDTMLNYEILDTEQALQIISKDHVAWRRLVNSADATGMSRGHWIRRPTPNDDFWPAKVVAIDSVFGTGRLCSTSGVVPAALAGSSVHDNTNIAARACSPLSPTTRRQKSPNSDSDISSGGVSQGRSSGDEEKGKC